MKQTKNGFTIVELLVVVGIIGLISAIVLVVLSSARDRGSDANVKANLVQVRVEADLYYSNNSESYGTFAAATCPTAVTAGSIFNDQTIINAIASALAAGGNGTRCVASGNSYAVAVGMKTVGQSWCVDSLGHSKQFAGTPTAAITGSSCS